jgi:hypothetical protein
VTDNCSNVSRRTLGRFGKRITNRKSLTLPKPISACVGKHLIMNTWMRRGIWAVAGLTGDVRDAIMTDGEVKKRHNSFSPSFTVITHSFQSSVL